MSNIIFPSEFVRQHTDFPEGVTPEGRLRLLDPLARAVGSLMDSAIRVKIWRDAESALQETTLPDEEVRYSAPSELEEDIEIIEAHGVINDEPKQLEYEYFSQPVLSMLDLTCSKCLGYHGHDSVDVRRGEAWVLGDEFGTNKQKVMEGEPVFVEGETGKLQSVVVGSHIETGDNFFNPRSSIGSIAVLKVGVSLPQRPRADGVRSRLSNYRETLLLPATTTDLSFSAIPAQLKFE